MRKKIAARYRSLVFALAMSACTSLLVSAVIVGLRSPDYARFIRIWPSAWLAGWPIVFLAILMIAPRVNRALDWFVESEN